MLFELHIKNLIIFDDVTINFKSNMTAITGDTGAGKSVILTALNLISGSKIDTKLIKHTEKQAEISASFILNKSNSIYKYLEQNDLLADESEVLDNNFTCILRRIISKEGRSKNYINNTPITLQILKNIGNKLLYIHGQHQHLNLFKSDYQRNTLDIYGQLQNHINKIKEIYNQYNIKKQILEELKNNFNFYLDSIDFYEYQLKELYDANLQKDEYEQINTQYKSLLELKDNQNIINNIINNYLPNITNNLEKVINDLNNFKSESSHIKNSEQLLNDALIAINESQNDLNKLNTESNNLNQLEELDKRLTLFHDLARKHKVQSKDLFNKQLELEAKINSFNNSEENLKKAQKDLENILIDYKEFAAKLTQARKSSSEIFIKDLINIMPTLGLPDFDLEIKINSLQNPTSNGLDQIDFYVKTNKDTNKEIISKVLSGGELSRLALAVQIICSKIENTPSLIFDEVDVGISGATAEIVGQLLKEMGANTQILCITHLPQVAAQADEHLLVTKTSTENKTISKVVALNKDERIKELARILGGVKITKQTLEHAKELLYNAQDFDYIL